MFNFMLYFSENANKTFDLALPDFWVGGEDLDNRGQWVWTDGVAFTFQNWAPNEPDLLPGFQCISIGKDRAFWYTADCFKEKPFVCELPALLLPTTSTRPPTLPSTTTPSIEISTTPNIEITTTEEEISTLGPPSYSCDDDTWAQFNDTHFCFKVFPKNVFDDAESGCKSYGGHLASIHSQEELAFIDTLLDNYYYWLGLCTSDNGFTWAYTDGTSIDFAINHWCSNGPQHTADTCVVLNPSSSTNCLTNIHKTLFTQALCKKPANVSYGTL
uniref:C-type lectin domain-containing protein n=1 Tax=Panagrolaimus sp. ES5 TaxID=591445 RepID=A0AC34GY58_9BILA